MPDPVALLAAEFCPGAARIMVLRNCTACSWQRLTANSNFSVADFGFGVDPPTVEDDRTTYSFRARFPVTDPDAEPVIRFVDWHCNLYYQYRHYTERFGRNVDYLEAAMKIDQWIRTGPKPG